MMKKERKNIGIVTNDDRGGEGDVGSLEKGLY